MIERLDRVPGSRASRFSRRVKGLRLWYNISSAKNDRRFGRPQKGEIGMKVSSLITKLTDLIDSNGDVDVKFVIRR